MRAMALSLPARIARSGRRAASTFSFIRLARSLAALEIRQDDVARALEQAAFDAELVSGLAGDVEFHHAVARPGLQSPASLDGLEPRDENPPVEVHHRHLLG